MKRFIYLLAIGFSLSTMAACGGSTEENVDDQTSPGVTAGGTGAGTTANGVGTSGTPGGLTDVGDTIRTEENRTTETR